MNHYQDIEEGLGYYLTDKQRQDDEARFMNNSDAVVRIFFEICNFHSEIYTISEIPELSKLETLILKGESQKTPSTSPLDYEEGCASFSDTKERVSLRWESFGNDLFISKEIL